MADIDGKDAVLGILLISVIGLGGFLGYMIITLPAPCEQCDDPTECDPCVPDPIPNPWGLPDDWSTAPNATYFTINNGTHVFNITLGEILDGVALALDEETNGNGAEINEYKNPLYLYTVQDEVSGIYYTGVDVLDILERWNTNFAFNMSFNSTHTPDGYNSIRYLNMSTGDIISKMYENDEEPVIIALAANKGWLPGSKLGNFTILGKNMAESISNLENITILDSWIVKVYVNDTLELIIDPTNMTTNEYTDNYWHEDLDWWSFNRTYWGRNISEIISHTSAAGLNYSVRIWSVDNWATPRPFGGGKENRYNNTDVEDGIIPPWNPAKDLVSDDVPIPVPDVVMNLVYADQEHGETGQGITDPIWPYRLMNGYHRGPFYALIPGRPRANYLSHVNKIDITSYTGPIPPGFDL